MTELFVAHVECSMVQPTLMLTGGCRSKKSTLLLQELLIFLSFGSADKLKFTSEVLFPND